MNVFEFMNIIEDFFDSVGLTDKERMYACNVYFNSYVLIENPNNIVKHQSLIECANNLVRLTYVVKKYDLPLMPIESFQELLNSQPIDFPYNCGYMYDVVREMRACENIFGQNISEVDYDVEELFEEPLKLNKGDSSKFFKAVKNLFECCIANQQEVHCILEIWLNDYIMPRYREKLISKTVMDELIRIAELVECKFSAPSIILDNKESINLVFGKDATFNGILSLSHFLDIIYARLGEKLKANTPVRFKKNGVTLSGVIIGTYDKNYIVQHESDCNGYTASVVIPEVVEEASYDR